MEDTKKWWQSTGIWGGVISILAKLVMVVFGIEISGTEVVQITDAVVLVISTVAGLIGDAMAIWGRKKATKAIA